MQINKSITTILGCFLLLLNACNYSKVSKVDIKNDNPFPIAVTIKTNNVQQTFSGIQPNSSQTLSYDWTAMNKEEGEFVFFIKNEQSGGVDSFHHGFIRHGELYNYIYLNSTGSELKVEISN